MREYNLMYYIFIYLSILELVHASIYVWVHLYMYSCLSLSMRAYILGERVQKSACVYIRVLVCVLIPLLPGAATVCGGFVTVLPETIGCQNF